MRCYELYEMEPVIAEARKQKQRMEELLGDFEGKARFEEADMKYLDSTLRGLESELRRLRRRMPDASRKIYGRFIWM